MAKIVIGIGSTHGSPSNSNPAGWRQRAERDKRSSALWFRGNSHEAKITDLPDIRFMSGTSEIRNWITLAGAVEGTDFEMNLLAYEPCYRSEAGTGCAGAYAYWQ